VVYPTKANLDFNVETPRSEDRKIFELEFERQKSVNFDDIQITKQ
jgi:hypothetical protein